MVVVPAPSILALPVSLIFITLLSLLAKVNVPDDTEVGFSTENAASPNVLEPKVRDPNLGTACLTVNVNVCVALT